MEGLQAKLRIHEQQATARSISIPETVSTLANDLASTSGPSDSPNHAKVYQAEIFRGEDSNIIAGRKSCPSEPALKQQPGQQLLSPCTTIEHESQQNARQIQYEHRTLMNILEGSHLLSNPVYADLQIPLLSLTSDLSDSRVSNPLTHPFDSMAPRLACSSGDDVLNPTTALTIPSGLTQDIGMPSVVMYDELQSDSTCTKLKQGDWYDLQHSPQAQRDEYGQSNQSGIYQPIMQSCQYGSLMQSVQTAMQDCNSDTRMHQDSISSTKCGALELLQLQNMTTSAKAAGFKDFDAVAEAYYLTNFRDDLDLSSIQKLSRNRHLPRILSALRHASQKRTGTERNELEQEFVTGAKEMLAREMLKINKLTSDPNLQDRRLEDQVSLMHRVMFRDYCRITKRYQMPNLWSLAVGICSENESLGPQDCPRRASLALSVLCSSSHDLHLHG
jgi:hypothetical protein